MVQIATAATALNIEVGPTARHWVPITFAVKVYVYFGDGATPAILALVVQALSFTLPERLLLLVLEV